MIGWLKSHWLISNESECENQSWNVKTKQTIWVRREHKEAGCYFIAFFKFVQITCIIIVSAQMNPIVVTEKYSLNGTKHCFVYSLYVQHHFCFPFLYWQYRYCPLLVRPLTQEHNAALISVCCKQFMLIFLIKTSPDPDDGSTFYRVEEKKKSGNLEVSICCQQLLNKTINFKINPWNEHLNIETKSSFVLS